MGVAELTVDFDELDITDVIDGVALEVEDLLALEVAFVEEMLVVDEGREARPYISSRLPAPQYS